MAHIQPAKKGYFFEQGYKDIWNVIKETFSEIKESSIDQIDELSSSNILVKVFRIFAIISIWVFGGLIGIAFSVAHLIVNFIFMLLYYVLFVIVLIIDRAYLSAKKVSISCRVDKANFMYPIYVCPNCGNEHDHLTPSIYGAFTRTCNCGTKLPTSIMSIKNKRADLYAYCPDCAKRGERTPLFARDSRPVCIPVVGGPSVGKSAFITAYTNLLVDSISKEKGVEIQFYDREVYDDYVTKQGFFHTGNIMKTVKQTDINKATSIAFSFFAKHRTLKPDRLVHIYDIAGESFLEGAQETQKEYESCDGLILIVDPFSIPDVKARFGSSLNETDFGSIGSVGIDDIMRDFVNNLSNKTKLPESKLHDIPLAIVINKTDAADLDSIIGDAAVKRVMKDHPDVFKDYFDTMDYLCREFLSKVDMKDVLGHIKNFKTTRFFAVSSIGHSLREGTYKPRNVVPVLDWIFKIEDKKLASLISATKFSDAKLPIEPDGETIETINIEDM